MELSFGQSSPPGSLRLGPSDFQIDVDISLITPAYSQYYWHIFVDQAVGNAFTEFLLPVAFKQDPRYFTKGHGGFFNRTGVPLSRLVITRTDSGESQINFSKIIGNGAAAGIASLYYPATDRTWTKTGQRWGQQLTLDATFNVIKEFWPDIRHSVLHQKN
jgi:hypothetical protein